MIHILGIGQACIDLTLPIEISSLEGRKGGAEPLPLAEMERLIHQSGRQPLQTVGGSCANALRGLASLGEKCALLTHLGNDILGSYFQKEMERLGIQGFYHSSDIPTGRVLCLITPDGERTMRYYTPLHPPAALAPSLPNVKIVHHETYSIQEKHFSLFSYPVINSLDLSSFELVEQNKTLLWKLIQSKVGVLFANRDEIKALTGHDAENGCLMVQEFASIAVILMGKEGCLVGSQGNLLHVPAYPAIAIDSTGAGDFFASGFLYGLLHGFSLKNCAQLGNRLGAAVVQVTGAQLPDAFWQEVRKSLHTI